MTPDRRRQIDALLAEALGREGAARAAYLDRACGDDVDLRREVESLLAGQAGAGMLEGGTGPAVPQGRVSDSRGGV